MATQVTLNSGSVDSAGSLALKTNGTTTAITIDTSQNVNFSATGQRITGDFSNATIANRVMFQTSTANSVTVVSAIPSGTATQANFNLHNNSDSTNASDLRLLVNASEARIQTNVTGTGTYLPMTFYTGGTERARIDSSGNVGIGTSSPATKLHVQKNGKAFQLYDGSTNDGVYAVFAGSSLTKNWCIGNQFNVNGSLEFTQTTANGGTTIGSTPSMVIDSSGNLLVGGTSPVTSNERFFIDQPTSAYWAQSIKLGNTSNGIIFTNTSGTASYTAVSFRNNGTTLSACGAITVSGTATAYGVGTSDYRLKENIENYYGGLSAIMALRPVTFTWKQSKSNDVGFIAHEIQAVIPQAVQGEKDAVDTNGNPEYQSIFPAPSQMIANLVAAIQEQQAIIIQLQADVAALKGTA